MDPKTAKFEGFGFVYKDELKFFVAKEEDLQAFKELLRKRILFRDISDFFTPTRMLGKGGSSKVYLVQSKKK